MNNLSMLKLTDPESALKLYKRALHVADVSMLVYSYADFRNANQMRFWNKLKIFLGGRKEPRTDLTLRECDTHCRAYKWLQSGDRIYKRVVCSVGSYRYQRADHQVYPLGVLDTFESRRLGQRKKLFGGHEKQVSCWLVILCMFIP